MEDTGCQRLHSPDSTMLSIKMAIFLFKKKFAIPLHFRGNKHFLLTCAENKRRPITVKMAVVHVKDVQRVFLVESCFQKLNGFEAMAFWMQFLSNFLLYIFWKIWIDQTFRQAIDIIPCAVLLIASVIIEATALRGFISGLAKNFFKASEASFTSGLAITGHV